jgi:beta-lactamase regulating signal transducer with metallopeptidase domain
MKICVAKLLILFNPINIHLLWLIVQLIALCETIATGFSTEAKHNAKILGKLSESIWGKLVKRHPELQQNIS